MTSSTMWPLHLMVVNPGVLQFGCRPAHVFAGSGGTIGSSIQADWQLVDPRDAVADTHAEISIRDGAYCLVERSGRTLFNDNPVPLSPGRIVRLSDGDVLQIGRYRIQVRLDDASAKDPDQLLLPPSLAEILGETTSGSGPFDPVPHDDSIRHGYRETADMSVPSLPGFRDGEDEVDPLLALESTSPSKRRSVTDELGIDSTHYGLSVRQDTQTDLADTAFEAVSNDLLGRPASLHGNEASVRPVSPPWLTGSRDVGQDGLPDMPSSMERFDSALPSTAHPMDARPPRAALAHSLEQLARHHDALMKAVDEGLMELLQALPPMQQPELERLFRNAFERSFEYAMRSGH